MPIKSLEELKALRSSLVNKVNLREKGEVADDVAVEVLVGMGTCGISAGARDTFNTLLEALDKKEIANVKVISVGCLGQCTLEPTVQVNIPGKEPVIYGNITEDRVEDLVQKVIIDNGHLEEDLVIPTFKKVEVK